MHEGNFTQQIVEAILTELKNYPAAKPTHIKVRVGEMLHLEPESVRLHFATITKGSALETATLELVENPVRVRCRKCLQIFHPDDHHALICNTCNTMDVDILDGQDIQIEKIDLEN